MLSPESVNLSNCDREPIHVPGSIQCHGCLLACDETGESVERCSENAAGMLRAQDGPVLGQRLKALLGAEAAGQLREALRRADEPTAPVLLFGVTVAGGRRFDVAVHRYDGAAIFEFEPAAGDDGLALDHARGMLARVRGLTDIDELVEVAARLVRDMLGYDRVMVYRFAHDGAGQVVSEARREDLESFLGQWFPESDIPQQARRLYLRNIVRVIGDVHATRCTIEPELDPAGRQLDLSFAHLRSVSPIHLEYLRNMGVAASMSISVVVDGELWGMIACHHYAPRVLPMTERVAAEMFGSFFSLHLQALKQKRSLQVATEARRALDRFLQRASRTEDVLDLLRSNLSEFAALMPCDGIGLWLGGVWTAQGCVPPADAIPGLLGAMVTRPARMIDGPAEGKIWTTDSLARAWEPAAAFSEEASGMLALPLSQLPRDYLLFFRREVAQTLDWAGRPEKVYETGPFGDRLTPRKSFAIWKETVRQHASPWTDADREIAEATRSALVETVLRHNEMMAEEREKADIRQRMLNEELNHRVKNILAVIKSLVEHSMQDGRDITDYVDSLRGRIQALAVAHDQVVRGAGGGALAELLGAELSPYGGGARTRLDGPGVRLDARAFSVMALVLHELATNAAKYGALSRSEGRVEVSWKIEPNGDCTVDWREHGGPTVVDTGRRGFGSALIERSVPHDLDGDATIDLVPSGLVARFRLPAQHIVAVAPVEEAGTAAGTEAAAGESDVLSDCAVLLVEDQMIIALDVEAMMLEGGVGSVVTAASVNEALRKLEGLTPDVAVLDVNLGTRNSAPVAEELRRRGVPYLFATGYGDQSMIPDGHQDAMVLPKPYESGTLLTALRALLEAS
ncbi:HWE histidine kinase domain-containing protein [Ancylobacter mangrovi]|uniref:HWE histidine kinase domain-containing protein n=1 Tax=Ancylobacter mangrovi TaxID=2972472 RepID=UPI0021638BD2|nr:HWE histidine kinase domain-containing protein [Ancylobacter mangrovi]MCS0504186.1 GAF domain-containing protein [Ancylobacter mangrovi]